MAVQSFRKNYVYRYKLSDSEELDRRQVAGITLTKSWTDFRSPKEELNIFIKTTSKPEGFIDFEKYDTLNNEIAHQSTYTGDVPDIISKEILYAMERFELVPIAKYYEIDVVQKDKNLLIKLIIESQKKRVEFENKKDEIKPVIENNIPILNTNNQQPQQYFNEDDIDKRGGFFGMFKNR